MHCIPNHLQQDVSCWRYGRPTRASASLHAIFILFHARPPRSNSGLQHTMLFFTNKNSRKIKPKPRVSGLQQATNMPEGDVANEMEGMQTLCLIEIPTNFVHLCRGLSSHQGIVELLSCRVQNVPVRDKGIDPL